MIRILQKDNFLYITGEPRTENELKETVLLFSYPDLDYTQDLSNNLRPFRDLTQKQEYYKLSLLDHLPRVLYEKYIPEVIGKADSEKQIQEAKEIAKLLGYSVDNFPEVPEIIYTCDIWNYLGEVYGEKVSRLIQEYKDLRIEDKEFLKKLSITGDQKKFKLTIEYPGLRRIYDFLPSGIQENLMIFGTTLTKIGKEHSIPEFRNQTDILPPPPDLKTEIYKEFEVGEVFWEGADNVKDRLQKIYDMCEVQRISKMVDLTEYFEFTHQWIDGKRYVRLSYRKLQ